MEGLTIREIKSSDCGPIMKLIHEYAGQLGEEELKVNISVKDLDRLGFNDMDGSPFFLGVVAELKEGDAKTLKVIGVALYHRKYSTWEGPVMHLNTFFVSEKFRRQGVGSKLLQNLGKIAQDKKYPRISTEVSKNNEPALKLLMKHGAINLTKEEAWLNYEFSSDAVKKMLKSPKPEVENIKVRPTEPKDCVQIKEMIQELAEFEKMPDGPKLSVKDLQRDGFYKLFPDYYSFVAEIEDPEEGGDTEIVGYSILFLTFDPILGKRVHLEDIYVTPKHRGKRIGEMLCQAVAQFVDADRYQGFTLEVLEWNTKAIQFYDKFGGINQTLGENGKESIRIKKDAIANLALSLNK